ncbi:hypothetical protein [Parapedobacter koreensis]|uniref:Uncharacterized protein n=1 Tax=Parapedobacter koreensis TaxID=332977 RepID=A0A1H7NN24_9SPHI|nr:hypothetical protein [Parapedobacter koreensis]SEL24973.1 hypothetical protein SAMN05421740_10449 [Parapedobacter koreensis]
MNAMKLNHLIIISPTITPAICGVSDYAYRVGEQLFQTGVFTKIAFGVDRVPKRKAKLSFVVKHWKAALKEIEADTCIFINYTPLGFSRFGYPSKFLNELQKTKNKFYSAKFFIMFHEIWNGNPKLRLHLKMIDRLSKKSCLRLVDIANGVATVTYHQKEKLKNERRNITISIQPIGANISAPPDINVLKTNRQHGVWVIFGLPHTRLWTLKKNITLIRELVGRGNIIQIKAIGPKSGQYSNEEIKFANENLGKETYIQLGVLSDSHISYELLKVEGAFVGQTYDSITKSGTFLSIVAHGVPVICDVDKALQDPPSDGLFRPKELLNGYDIVMKKSNDRTKKMLEWYHKRRTWKAIGENLTDWMSQ